MFLCFLLIFLLIILIQSFGICFEINDFIDDILSLEEAYTVTAISTHQVTPPLYGLELEFTVMQISSTLDCPAHQVIGKSGTPRMGLYTHLETDSFNKIEYVTKPLKSSEICGEVNKVKSLLSLNKGDKIAKSLGIKDDVELNIGCSTRDDERTLNFRTTTIKGMSSPNIQVNKSQKYIGAFSHLTSRSSGASSFSSYYDECIAEISSTVFEKYPDFFTHLCYQYGQSKVASSGTKNEDILVKASPEDALAAVYTDVQIGEIKSAIDASTHRAFIKLKTNIPEILSARGGIASVAIEVVRSSYEEDPKHSMHRSNVRIPLYKDSNGDVNIVFEHRRSVDSLVTSLTTC